MNHHHRPARTAAALALAAATVLAGSTAAAAHPVRTATCATPLADNAGGATFTVTSGTVQPGGTITFTGTGFERTDTDGLGQTLAFKLNDQVLWTDRVKASDDGAVSGSLRLADLPAADIADVVEQACGAYWLRVLVGSSAAGDTAPARSVHATFVVAAATPTTSPSAAAAGTGTASPSAAARAATGPATGGTLPQTGLADSPGAWLAGLVAIAAIALAAERSVRRRRSASPARTQG